MVEMATEAASPEEEEATKAVQVSLASTASPVEEEEATELAAAPPVEQEEEETLPVAREAEQPAADEMASQVVVVAAGRVHQETEATAVQEQEC